MARQAKLTVYVTKSNTKSHLRVTTVGTYAGISMKLAGIDIPGEPLFTTATAKAFWLAVLNEAENQISALP